MEIKRSDDDLRQWETGAVRDSNNGKGRFDLLPTFGILAFAKQMERGASRYSARNWEKGIPTSVYMNSALRHLLKAQAGFVDEPHMDAAIWNIGCLIETRERIKRGLLPVELDDLPSTFSGLEPGF